MSETTTNTLLSRDQAAEILAGVVPAAEVVEVVRCDGGRISGALEIRCADPEDSVILKVYAPDSGWRLAKECSVYRILAANGVTAIPTLLHADRGSDALPQPFLVMSKLAGRTMGAVHQELTPAEVGDVYRQMGVLLAEIHDIEQEAFGYRTTEILMPEPTNAGFMARFVAERRPRLAEYGFDAKLSDAVAGYVAERSEIFAQCVVPRLLHYDFHEGNVIVDRTSDGPVLTGCVDVENAMAGDPFADLSKLDSYSIRGDEVKLAGLEAGYGPFPADWRERFALYRLVHYVELWEFFASIGQREHLDRLSADMRAITSAR